MSSRRTTQWGQVDGEDVQTIEQILAEFLFGNVPVQIAISGGNDSYVNMQRPDTSQPFELPILQNAQKFGLQFRRRLTDLVQKESAFISKFDASNFLTDSAGKSPLFMPE